MPVELSKLSLQLGLYLPWGKAASRTSSDFYSKHPWSLPLHVPSPATAEGLTHDVQAGIWQ